MKIFVFCLAFALVACASASIIPDYDGAIYDFVPDGEPRMETVEPNRDMVDHSRIRRFSCDLFSFSSQWITPNSAVCAAKCMFKGRRGGSCHNGQCICRN